MAKKNTFKTQRLKLILGVVIGVLLFAIGFGAVKYLASTSTDSRSQAAGSQVYGCGFVGDCPANQGYVSCVDHVCQKASPTAAIPTPVGNCSQVGEASNYGCCRGLMPDGNGRCKVAECGKEGESAYYGCCSGLTPKNPCPQGVTCEAVCTSESAVTSDGDSCSRTQKCTGQNQYCIAKKCVTVKFVFNN